MSHLPASYRRLFLANCYFRNQRKQERRLVRTICCDPWPGSRALRIHSPTCHQNSWSRDRFVSLFSCVQFFFCETSIGCRLKANGSTFHLNNEIHAEHRYVSEYMCRGLHIHSTSYSQRPPNYWRTKRPSARRRAKIDEATDERRKRETQSKKLCVYLFLAKRRSRQFIRFCRHYINYFDRFVPVHVFAQRQQIYSCAYSSPLFLSLE